MGRTLSTAEDIEVRRGFEIPTVLPLRSSASFAVKHRGTQKSTAEDTEVRRGFEIPTVLPLRTSASSAVNHINRRGHRGTQRYAEVRRGMVLKIPAGVAMFFLCVPPRPLRLNTGGTRYQPQRTQRFAEVLRYLRSSSAFLRVLCGQKPTKPLRRNHRELRPRATPEHLRGIRAHRRRREYLEDARCRRSR